MISSDSEIIARLDALLREPFGLLLDIDGTLSPIAATPDQAFVPAATRDQLRRLVGRVALVATISGRAARDARAMVGVDGMVFVGNHGLEVARGTEARPLPGVEGAAVAVGAVLDAARAHLNLPGLIFEDKGLTASVHYRQAADPEAAGSAAGKVLRQLVDQHGLRLTPGRMVWEIRPPVDAHKGSAVRWLQAEYSLASILFSGDDRTDVDAFDALIDLRERGVCQTVNAGVVAAETPREVIERADLLVDGIEGMTHLLRLLGERLSA